MKLVLQHPIKVPQISQGFGESHTSPDMIDKYKAIGLKGHNGYDYVALDGTPVMAMHDGTVTYAGLDGSNGNLIVIMTDRMYDYKDGEAFYKTYYGHLKTGTFKVTAGTKVKTGQVIALADNSGMSTGSHLHMGLKAVKQGEQPWEWSNIEQGLGYNGAIDPTPYLPPVAEFQTPMKYGDTSSDVEKLQAFMIRHKYMDSFVDGIGFGTYGPKTALAVYKFQLEFCKLSSWEKLTLKGRLSKVGPKTLAKLNELY